MSNIEPIPTFYNGCHFRSRTEARWAIFFDCLMLEWHYEPEGFKMGPPHKKIYYLPDFFLPEINAYVEIKGPSPNTKDLRKIMTFKALKTDVNMIVLFGSVYPERQGYMLYGKDKGDEQWFESHSAYFAVCQKCRTGLYIVSDDDNGDIFCLIPCQGQCFGPEKINTIIDSFIMEAYRTASYARFEHQDRNAEDLMDRKQL